MKNILLFLLFFTANLAFAQKPDYNPNRDSVKFSGVIMTPPSDGKTIIFRTPFSSGINPLFVLNGKVISKEEYQQIDAKKIKSMKVVKDKKATDLYGEKGKNGVIIIKAKKNWKRKLKNQKKVIPLIAN